MGLFICTLIFSISKEFILSTSFLYTLEINISCHWIKITTNQHNVGTVDLKKQTNKNQEAFPPKPFMNM